MKLTDKTVISIGHLVFNSQQSLRLPSLRENFLALAKKGDEAILMVNQFSGEIASRKQRCSEKLWQVRNDEAFNLCATLRPLRLNGFIPTLP